MTGMPTGPLPASVNEVLDRLGVEYDSSGWGDEVAGRCPVHDDSHPSASFNVSTGLWYCHACGAGGTLAWLVATVTGENRHAARWWLMNVDYSQAAAQEQRDIPTHGEYLLAGLEDVPEIALDAFGLTREAVDAYGIRWRPERYGKRGAVYPDAFMFGIRDPASGRLWGTHRKDADGAWTSPGTPKGQTLFGIERFQSGGTAILVESPLDTAVLLAAGLDGGLASFGAKVSQRQAALLSERASRIVLALDNDPAGRAAQRALAGRLSIPVYCFNYGDALSLVRPGRAKDPGEMEADDLRWAIRHAT